MKLIKGGPKVLIADIETAPIEGRVWGLWDQNIGLSQIVKDWSLLSWAAKWRGSSEVMYEDNRKRKDPRDDKAIVKSMWGLLDEADVVVAQNGNQFDIKKLNARFAKHGLGPPSTFKKIDTKLIAKQYFGFTSNSLEYMCEHLCTKYKKLKSRKFIGMELWNECLSGNLEAWDEMRKYNIRDVLALDELYPKLLPWASGVNFSLYRTDGVSECSCGATNFQRRGFYYTSTGKYQKHRCMSCGSEKYSGKNLFVSEEKLRGVTR